MAIPCVLYKCSSGATVTLTVEVVGCGSWGSDCTVAQIHKQAGEAAVDRLEKAIGTDRSMRIIGAPNVTAVMCRDDR